MLATEGAKVQVNPLARGVTVARLTLDQLVLVRIQAGQRSVGVWGRLTPIAEAEVPARDGGSGGVGRLPRRSRAAGSRSRKEEAAASATNRGANLAKMK